MHHPVTTHITLSKQAKATYSMVQSHKPTSLPSELNKARTDKVSEQNKTYLSLQLTSLGCNHQIATQLARPHQHQQQHYPKARTQRQYKAANLLSQIQTSVVCYKDPADDSTQKGKGPGDPKLVTVAQVVEPDHHQDGPHLARGC